MKKILYSDMNSLGNIVDDFLQNPKFREGMKTSTLFKFWSQVVGKKFEKVSKAEALTCNNGKYILIVACSSAAVTSELSMYKKQLLNKINAYSKPLDIEIFDIHFSHKIWQSEKDSVEHKFVLQEENPYKENLEGFNPDNIELNDEEIAVIRRNIEDNRVLSAAQKERLFNSIVQDIKIQKFLKKDK